jgi:hypothetical protein
MAIGQSALKCIVAVAKRLLSYSSKEHVSKPYMDINTHLSSSLGPRDIWPVGYATS